MPEPSPAVNHEQAAVACPVAAPAVLRWVGVAGALVLLAVVVAHVDVGETCRLLSRARYGLFVLGVALFVPASSLFALRSVVIAPCFGFRLPFLAAWRYFVVSVVACQVLPSTVGGDALRIGNVRSYASSVSDAASAVILERALGLFAQLVLVSLSPLLFRAEVFDAPATRAVWSVVVLLLVAFVAGVLGLRVFGRTAVVQAAFRVRFVGPALRSACRALDLLGHMRSFGWRLACGVTISLAIQALTACALCCYLTAVGESAPVLRTLFVSTAAQVMAMVPVTLGSLGITEGLYVLLLGEAGVPKEAAFAAAAMARAGFAVVSVFVLLLFHRVIRELRMATGSRFQQDPGAPAGPIEPAGGTSAAERPPPNVE